MKKTRFPDGEPEPEAVLSVIDSFVRFCDVVITGKDCAAALKYDEENMFAPMIVLLEKDAAAAALERVAERLSLPVIKNISLVKNLASYGKSGETIPEATFRDVSLALARLDSGGFHRRPRAFGKSRQGVPIKIPRPLSIELGASLFELTGEGPGREKLLSAPLDAMRKKLISLLGIAIPRFRVSHNPKLKTDEYRILFKGLEAGRGRMELGWYLPPQSGTPRGEIAPPSGESALLNESAAGGNAARGEAVSDGNARGASALPREAAPLPKNSGRSRRAANAAVPVNAGESRLPEGAALTVVPDLMADPRHLASAAKAASSVLLRRAGEIIQKRTPELLGRDEVEAILDAAEEKYPVVTGEVKGLLSLGIIREILQSLVSEQVSIRHIAVILETLADWSSFGPAPNDLIVEQIRQSLKRQICLEYADDRMTLRVLTLEPKLEKKFAERSRDSVVSSGTEDASEEWADIISPAVKGMEERGFPPVILCSPKARFHVKEATRRKLPDLAVLSYVEIPSDISVEPVGEIRFEESIRLPGWGNEP